VPSFLGDDVGDDDASPQWTAKEAECMIRANHEDGTKMAFLRAAGDAAIVSQRIDLAQMFFKESLLKLINSLTIFVMGLSW